MNLGCCHVTLAAVRANCSDSAEMTSQLLFGEFIEVIEVKDNWSFIRCIYDKYEGWVDTKQYKIVKKIEDTSFMSFHLSHACQLKSHSIPLVLGSRLPNFDGINFKINKDKYLYNGKVIEKDKNPISNLKKVALKYLNAPYLWGGRSPFGIDSQDLLKWFLVFSTIPCLEMHTCKQIWAKLSILPVKLV